jgi:hypothetical protein
VDSEERNFTILYLASEYQGTVTRCRLHVSSFASHCGMISYSSSEAIPRVSRPVSVTLEECAKAHENGVYSAYGTDHKVSKTGQSFFGAVQIGHLYFDRDSGTSSCQGGVWKSEDGRVHNGALRMLDYSLEILTLPALYPTDLAAGGIQVPSVGRVLEPHTLTHSFGLQGVAGSLETFLIYPGAKRQKCRLRQIRTLQGLSFKSRSTGQSIYLLDSHSQMKLSLSTKVSPPAECGFPVGTITYRTSLSRIRVAIHPAGPSPAAMDQLDFIESRQVDPTLDIASELDYLAEVTRHEVSRLRGETRQLRCVLELPHLHSVDEALPRAQVDTPAPAQKFLLSRHADLLWRLSCSKVYVKALPSSGKAGECYRQLHVVANTSRGPEKAYLEASTRLLSPIPHPVPCSVAKTAPYGFRSTAGAYVTQNPLFTVLPIYAAADPSIDTVFGPVDTKNWSHLFSNRQLDQASGRLEEWAILRGSDLNRQVKIDSGHLPESSGGVPKRPVPGWYRAFQSEVDGFASGLVDKFFWSVFGEVWSDLKTIASLCALFLAAERLLQLFCMTGASTHAAALSPQRRCRSCGAGFCSAYTGADCWPAEGEVEGVVESSPLHDMPQVRPDGGASRLAAQLDRVCHPGRPDQPV